MGTAFYQAFQVSAACLKSSPWLQILSERTVKLRQLESCAPDDGFKLSASGFYSMLPADSYGKTSGGQRSGKKASSDLSAELSRFGVPRPHFDALLAADGVSAQDLSIAEHLWAQIARADVPSIISALLAFQLCDSEKRALLVVSLKVNDLQVTTKEKPAAFPPSSQAGNFRGLLNCIIQGYRYLDLNEVPFEEISSDLLVYAFGKIDKMYASREFGSGSSGDLLRFAANDKIHETISAGGGVDDEACESASSRLREEREQPETAIERIAHALCDVINGDPQRSRPEGWHAAKASIF